LRRSNLLPGRVRRLCCTTAARLPAKLGNTGARRGHDSAVRARNRSSRCHRYVVLPVEVVWIELRQLFGQLQTDSVNRDRHVPWNPSSCVMKASPDASARHDQTVIRSQRIFHQLRVVARRDRLDDRAQRERTESTTTSVINAPIANRRCVAAVGMRPVYIVGPAHPANFRGDSAIAVSRLPRSDATRRPAPEERAKLPGVCRPPRAAPETSFHRVKRSSTIRRVFSSRNVHKELRRRAPFGQQRLHEPHESWLFLSAASR